VRCRRQGFVPAGLALRTIAAEDGRQKNHGKRETPRMGQTISSQLRNIDLSGAAPTSEWRRNCERGLFSSICGDGNDWIGAPAQFLSGEKDTA
jgi:hypothetical protein